MREEYIKMREKGNYDINWFYKYYLEQGGKPITLNDFYYVFTKCNLDEIIVMMDYRFAINKLEYTDGRLIKVIE
jgi:hypothetical protein